MTTVRRGMWALLALCLCGACSGASGDADPAAVVRAYNEALVVAYRTGVLDDLSRVAGPDEVRRVGTLVDLKRAADLVLECRVESLEVLDVRDSAPDGMTVTTRERWTYRDRPLRPGMRPGEPVDAIMDMEYDLTRGDDGTWRVAQGRTLAMSRPGAGNAPGRES